MNRRKYIASLGLVGFVGYKSNETITEPSLAVDINLTNEVTVPDVDVKKYHLTLDLDNFELNTYNMYNVNPEYIIKAKTRYNSGTENKESEEIIIAEGKSKEDIESKLMDVPFSIPLTGPNDIGLNDFYLLYIDFIIETKNPNLGRFKTTEYIDVRTGYDKDDIVTKIKSQEIIGDSVPSNMNATAIFELENERPESRDITENITVNILDEDMVIESETFNINSGEIIDEEISFEVGDVQENKEYNIEIEDSVIDERKLLDIIDIDDPVLETINVADYTSPSGTGNHYWRGYSFVIEESITVNQLIGSRTGESDTASNWYVALYKMPGNNIDVEDEKPEELLASRTLPGSSNHEQVTRAIDELTLEPGAYLIAQGRNSGSQNHHEFSSIDVSSLISSSDLISDWGPSNGDAWRWDNGEPELLLNSSLRDTNSARPAVGIGHSEYEE